jgi:transposase
MFGQGGPVKVYVATRPVDFRKGIDGLALAVQEMFGLDPFCGAVFVFRAKRADRIKLLVWDQTGMVLVHKRLEGGKFVWPQVRDGVMRMSSAQLAALFESRDWTGGWCGRSGRGVRWSRDDRLEAWSAPVLAGRNGIGVIHFRAWMPTPSAARTLT